jgi:hypothetical protein
LVLESNRKKVSLLGGEIFALGTDNFLKIKDHIVKSFGLFGNSGHEDAFL